MLRCSLLLLLLVVGACHRDEPAVAHSRPENTETRGHIDRFVSSGRTPASFAQLATALEPVRQAGDPRLAEDAELRLLALALPFVEAARSRPIDVEVDQLAVTVWPALLAGPLTSETAGDLGPRADESAPAYIARLCDGVLASECTGIGPENQAIAVRAAVLQRAERRMRDALATCIMCSSPTEPGWRELEWKWESLERAATRTALEARRAARAVSTGAVGAL